MKALIASAIIAGLGVAVHPMVTPCAQEDSTYCVWDAKHRGNGQGHSLLNLDEGVHLRIPHRIAHALTH